MKSSAFYNLKNRLHINSELGFITDEDFELMKKQHAIDVENNDFDMVVEKILSKKFLKLNKNTVVVTSSIVEIQKI